MTSRAHETEQEAVPLDIRISVTVLVLAIAAVVGLLGYLILFGLYSFLLLIGDGFWQGLGFGLGLLTVAAGVWLVYRKSKH
jgi:hypothetical protein